MGEKTYGSKDARKTIQYAVANGFSVNRSGKHIKLTKEDQVITVSTSPSCPYGYSNALKDIKKALNNIKEKHDSLV